MAPRPGPLKDAQVKLLTSIPPALPAILQSRKNVEGSLFVVKRRTVPRFEFVVLNRLSVENCREDLLGEFEFELSPPYLLYRSKTEVGSTGIAGRVLCGVQHPSLLQI